jgi:ADP-heptose:LPS heptosyltransferase
MPEAAACPRQACGGIDLLLARDDGLPAYDMFAALLSLPGLLGTEITTIPGPAVYLTGDPSEAEIRRRQLSHLKRPWIGIAWQGNPQHKADRRRSIPLAALAGAIGNNSINLISLQVGAGHDQIAGMAKENRPFDPFAELPSHDYADTAAVIANMDLVVTIDSAVAHLAAAMGKPVWLLLPYAADWRWMRDREDSPWYPTMRLFRQHRAGDWSYVFSLVAEALRQWR